MGTEIAATMDLSEEKVNEKLQEFVKNFVVIYEKLLIKYINIIEENIKKPGKSANLCINTLKIGKSGTEAFEDGTQALLGVSFDILCKIIYDCGVRYNRNEVKKLLEHLYLFKKEPARVRKELVRSAFRIFCSFECQFVQVHVDGFWERAMTKVAEDAVGRAINYYKANPEVKFSADSITCGVIFGKSKKFKSLRSGRTVQYKNLNWKTAQLFSQIGLTDKKKFYHKISEPNGVKTFGYRLRTVNDKLDGYNEDKPPESRYTYILKQNEDKQVEQLLSDIDKNDHNLAKIEERLTEVILEKNEDVEEDIKNIEKCIEANLQVLQLYIINNQNQIWQYLNFLIQQQAERTHDQLDNIKVQNEVMSTKLEVIEQQNQELYVKLDNTKTNKKLDDINQQNQAIYLKLDNIEQQQVKSTEIKKPPIWFGVVDKLPSFIGRKDQLRNIDVKLKKKIIVVICGLGGVGKTELALEYAHNYCDKAVYFVIRIDASSYETTQQGFRDVHEQLELKLEDRDGEIKSIQSIVEDVYRELGGKGLFIFDNAENYLAIKHFLPLKIIHKPFILITSPNVSEIDWNGRRLQIETLKLDGFTDEEAEAFVKRFLKIKDNLEDTDVEGLIKKSHNFPLALNQAVAYINDIISEFEGSIMRKKLSEYLNKLYENPETFLNYGIEDYMKTIFENLEIIDSKIQTDTDNGHQAKHLLNIVSYFMPSSIPETLFLNGLAKGNGDKLLEITKGLKKYAVLKLNNGMFSIHGMVQEAIRLELKKQRKELRYLRDVLHLLKQTLDDQENIKMYSRHIISAWKYSREYSELIKTYIIDDLKATTSFFDVICEGNSYETVDVIIQAIKATKSEKLKVIINKRNKKRETKLHNAALNGNEKIVRILVENGADINANNNIKWKPLHFAAKNGYLKIVKFLLEENAYLECKTGYKYTPLHLASKNGRTDVVNFLLSKGANINAEANHRETPLHFAVKANETECVEALLKHDTVNVHAETKHKMTCLHFAVKCDNLEVVRLLLKKRAEVNVKNLDNFTPLHLASINNFLEIVLELLKVDNIEINAQTTCNNDETSSGNTPLHFASERGNLEIVVALIKAGAKVDIVNSDGKTAKDLATEQGVINMFSNIP